jgi:hypothetical protein
MLASTTPSLAEEGEQFRYGLEGNNLVFTNAGEAIAGGSFRTFVRDGQRANISVELVDIVSNSTGSKKAIPLDSSPFSPKGLVKFTKNYPIYTPSEEFQYFETAIRFKDDITVDRPVLGGIAITLVPVDRPDKEVVVQSKIVATFAYMPSTGIDLEKYAPALTLTGPIIERRTPDFFPLSLIPELPFVFNHGDVRLSHQLKNTGKIFLETTTERSAKQVGLFGQRDKMLIEDSKTAFLVPEQYVADVADIAFSESVDRNLGIGLYSFEISATGEMGDEINARASNQQLLFVFPWKQTLLAMGVLVLLRKRIRRTFSSFAELIRAFRDFLKSRTPHSTRVPAPRPSTFVPVGARSALASNQAPRPLYAPTESYTRTSPYKPRPGSSEGRPLYPYWYEPPTNGS